MPRKPRPHRNRKEGFNAQPPKTQAVIDEALRTYGDVPLIASIFIGVGTVTLKARAVELCTPQRELTKAERHAARQELTARARALVSTKTAAAQPPRTIPPTQKPPTSPGLFRRVAKLLEEHRDADKVRALADGKLSVRQIAAIVQRYRIANVRMTGTPPGKRSSLSPRGGAARANRVTDETVILALRLIGNPMVVSDYFDGVTRPRAKKLAVQIRLPEDKHNIDRPAKIATLKDYFLPDGTILKPVPPTALIHQFTPPVQPNPV